MSNSPYRPTTNVDRTPIQAGLSDRGSEYGHYRMLAPMLGVVLNVYPADAAKNKSAQITQDRRGSYHACSVLVLGSNNSSQLILPHVTLTPDSATGLDNYCERLPRGSSALVDGENFEESLSGIDPYTLDGDWCIIGFLGGNIDQPFVMRWFSHPRNVLDPQSTGQGGLDSNGTPRALDQSGRVFTRTNGVETVVNKDGDVYFSTRLSGATLKFERDQAPVEGRWNRTVPEDYGGSVLVNIKPSQVVELSWDPLKEGVGIMGRHETALPQTNPVQSQQIQDEYVNTHVVIDKDNVTIQLPKALIIETGDNTVIDSTNLVELEASEIKLGSDATQGVPRGDDLKTWLENLTVLTAMGPARINPADIATFLTQVVSTKSKVE